MVTKIKQSGIDNLAVGQAQLAADAVTAAKIVDGAVGAAEIDVDAVGASEIAAGAVGTSEIADGTIATADLDPTARPAFTKTFASSQQTITAGGLLTLAHSLGVVPKIVFAELVCITGELNWATNDRLQIACGAGSDSASNRGLGVYTDATNVYVRFGSAAGPLVVNNKTSGATAAITPANWKLVMSAWA